MPDDYDFLRGPGRHQHKSPRGPVLLAYVDTDALDRPCDGRDNCGAAIGDFCTFPDGSQRHAPCASRTRPRQTPAEPGGVE